MLEPAKAETFTSTFISTGAGGNWSSGLSWIGGVSPGGSCDKCEIIISPGATMSMDIPIDLFDTSLLIIGSNAVATVNQPLQLDNNSELLVGTDGSTAASLIVRQELDLTTNSFIRLANINTFIDASIPSNGTGLVNGGPGTSGIYYITGPLTNNKILSPTGYQNPFPPPPTIAAYLLNCNGASPNTCTTGFVYGPAISAFVNGVNTFVAFTPLPVELVKFAATLATDQSVELSWTTAEEVNSNYFSVQRSVEGAHFIEMSIIRAKGFCSKSSNYAMTDRSPLTGTGYYRLKIVDLDSKSAYSKILSVSTDTKGPEVLLFSNPFTDQVRLEINAQAPDEIHLTLTGIGGKVFWIQQCTAQPGSNMVNLQAGDGLSSGLYLLHIQGAHMNRTIKLLKR